MIQAAACDCFDASLAVVAPLQGIVSSRLGTRARQGPPLIAQSSRESCHESLLMMWELLPDFVRKNAESQLANSEVDGKSLIFNAPLFHSLSSPPKARNRGRP